MENKRGKYRITILNAILIVAVLVFLFAVYKLYGIFSEYDKAGNEYKNIQKTYVKKTEDAHKEEGGEVDEEDTPMLRVDFSKLTKINADIVGWIYFEEPSVINYPIVKSHDNQEYLTQTFEKKKNSSGALFVDMRNSACFTDKNTVIHGHNMKNGSMFGKLRKYKDENFCKEHPYFYIYTPDGKESRYQIFSTTIVTDVSDSYTISFYNDEEYGKYIEKIVGRSRYKTNAEVTTDSQILSLSTCTNVEEDQRLLIHAVKIGEKQVW